MKKLLFKVIIFALAFGIIIALFPEGRAETSQTIDPSDPEIIEAISEIDFYSSYNYQTLTADRFQKLSTDFFVPANYGNVTITYNLDSDFLELSQDTENITLRTTTGSIEIEVYHVTMVKLPTIFQGDQNFELEAVFSTTSETYAKSFVGTIVPIIPDDFVGGSLYTLIRYGKMFLEGAILTLGISLAGTLIGFILALLIATARIQKIEVQDSKTSRIIKTALNKISSVYIAIFRGTPMIVQASFFWYGFGLFGNPLLCGLFVVSINTAAYIAEIIRGSVQSLDKGQSEGALSLGLSYSQTMFFVVLPQAIKISLPAIGNEFVINIKDTAVLSVIGIFELFNQTRKITGMHYRQLEAYAVVALIYLFLTYSLTSFLKAIEKRMDLQPLELQSSN